MNRTAIIIINYNNCRDTLNCIDSIELFNTAPIKIVVVDNASDPDDAEALRQGLSQRYGDDFCHYSDPESVMGCLNKVSMIASRENVGYARGNNIGLKAVYTDSDISHVLILNNDILFICDLIPSLLVTKAKLNDCGIISPVLFNRDQSDYDYACARPETSVSRLAYINFFIYLHRLFNRGYNPIKNTSLLRSDMPKDSVIRIDLPSGSCMLADKLLFQEVGSFDPNTFLYFEENILNKKIKRFGLHNYLSLAVGCIHLGAATTSKQCKSSWLTLVSKSSELYYVDKYSGASWWLKQLHKLSVKVYLTLFSWQKKAM